MLDHFAPDLDRRPLDQWPSPARTGSHLGTVPVLTVVFAHLLFHDERMSACSMVGALIGFTGVLAVGARFTAVVMLIPMSGMIDQPWNLHVSWSTAATLVFLGTVGGALPGLFFYTLLARVGATRASLVAYLVLAVAVILGAVFLAERFP